MKILKEMLEKIVSQKIFFAVMAIIFLVGFILRINVLLYNKSFWDDEMFVALNILSRNYGQLFDNLNYLQVCPPLFLVVVKFMFNLSNLGGNIYLKDVAFRVFPFFCSVVSIPLFAYLVQQLFKNKFVTWTATVLLAVSVGAINYAAELKQYSCEMLFTLILLIVFYKIDLVRDSYKKILALALLVSVAPWFSITSFFIIPVGFLIMLIEFFRHFKVCSGKFLAFWGIFLFVFALYFQAYLSKIFASYPGMSFCWQGNFLNNNNGIFLFNQIFQYYFSLNLNKLILIYIVFSLIALGVSKNYKRSLLVFVPILFTVFASYNHLWPLKDRLELFLLPMFIVILCLPLKFLKDNVFNTSIVLVFVMTLCFSSLKKDTTYYIQHKGHNREIAVTLYGNASVDDILIVDPYDSMWSYYVLPYGLKNRTTLFHLNNKIVQSVFSSSDEQFFKKLPKGNYWICYLETLNKDFEHYLYSNKSIHILKEYKFVRSTDHKMLVYFRNH